MPMPFNLAIPRSLIRAAGIVLLVASLAFLVRAAIEADLAGLMASVDAQGAAMLSGLAAVYGAALGLLALAWWLTLAKGDGDQSFMPAFIVYGLSVFPKYLPGSVFQYASRQTLGARYGWRQRDIAKASAAEIILHLVAALAIFLILDQAFGFGRMPGLVTAAFAAIVIGGVAFLAVRAPAIRTRLFGALVAQILFFGLLALIAAGCALLFGASTRTAFDASAMFLLAWLIGFITPGAPGGIGVREASVLVTTSAIMGPGPALLFAAATRIVTLGGDALFALGALVAGQFRPHEQAGARQD